MNKIFEVLLVTESFFGRYLFFLNRNRILTLETPLKEQSDSMNRDATGKRGSAQDLGDETLDVVFVKNSLQQDT